MPVDPAELANLLELQTTSTEWKRALQVMYHTILNLEAAGIDVTLNLDVSGSAVPAVELRFDFPKKIEP